MQALKKQLTYTLALFLFGSLLFANPARAEIDLTAQTNYIKARAVGHQQKTDHAIHVNPTDNNQAFHGVFYGYLPCNDCPGIKMTLSLKQNNNYLLVTQSAKESSREFYEKGKYSWNDENHTLVLTPRKGAATRQYLIDNKESLIQLNSDGTRMSGEHILRRSDTVKSHEVHLH